MSYADGDRNAYLKVINAEPAMVGRVLERS
jgi:hypothetical protein